MRRIKGNISFLFMIVGLVFGGAVIQVNAQNDLTGTYELDMTRSENVSEVLESAVRNNYVTAADRQDIENKLEAPHRVSIDIRGRQITLLTSQSSNPLTFVADGRTRISTRDDGSEIRVRASLWASTLTVSSFGGRTDYTLTFVSLDMGEALSVTRRITTDYLKQTIFADSFYTKTGSDAIISENPDDDRYSNTDLNDKPDTRNTPRVRIVKDANYVVPNGVVLTGTLKNRITTEVSQNNDRFSLMVQYPDEYYGAVLEGYLSDVKRSGRIIGRSSFTMNFDSIRLANGRVYDFAGVLQSATDRSGKIIAIGNEGEAKGKNQTKESVKRSGIGAGIGAILGGIIGGGKGAAIGAAIGGGAGTGSVIAQGKGDLEMEEGSIIEVESTSPYK